MCEISNLCLVRFMAVTRKMASIIKAEQRITPINLSADQVYGAGILPNVPETVIGDVYGFHNENTVYDSMPNQDNSLSGMANRELPQSMAGAEMHLCQAFSAWYVRLAWVGDPVI